MPHSKLEPPSGHLMGASHRLSPLSVNFIRPYTAGVLPHTAKPLLQKYRLILSEHLSEARQPRAQTPGPGVPYRNCGCLL